MNDIRCWYICVPQKNPARKGLILSFILQHCCSWKSPRTGEREKYEWSKQLPQRVSSLTAYLIRHGHRFVIFGFVIYIYMYYIYVYFFHTMIPLWWNIQHKQLFQDLNQFIGIKHAPPSLNVVTYCVLVTSYDEIELIQHWPRLWLLAWRHWALAWLNVDFLSGWRHQMETFSASLALCAGNSLVTGEIPAQTSVTRSFGVFFDLRLNKQWSKQSWCWWFETPSLPLWCHCND